MSVYVDSSRTIDRARLRLRLDDGDVAWRRSAVLEAIENFDLVPVSTAVLERAAEPFPTMIGSLDAIHLASARLARPELDQSSFATHDRQLALAARPASSVSGVPTS
ncbi:MAG: hypothetical protein H0W07_09240 [Chloroflexi bacterium]|nr:hypothetical protein [Chloroflexota bacterium]